ncbi:NAD(P)-binding protein [Athelia psychrophila]|uniref:NAD(P)-binding protein n=1 Tax=Athelia psychrophila TaxID=1759441 RepID=A0A166FAS1_9AGAM|nr:NAD(P)-binding protein [Fibularhizoctonia sp. CBS 109695]
MAHQPFSISHPHVLAMILDDPTHEHLLVALFAAFLSAILVAGWRLLSRHRPIIRDVKTEYPSTDIVGNFQHNIYPRIETRKGGPLARASEGKTLLITGASKGVGRSIAIMHAHTRPKCIILIARSIPSLDSVASELAAIDSEIRIIKASVDVCDSKAVSTFFKNLWYVEKVGRIDVLFANAGYLEPIVPFAQQDISLWTKAINTNVMGVAVVTHEFLRHNFAAVGGNPDGTTEDKNKKALQNATIIITSSIGAALTFPGCSAYQPSKTLINRFCEFLDAEYGAASSFGADGLRTFCFHPGGIPTDLAQNMPKFILDHWRDNGHDSPDLSGGFTAWLLTPEADFLRGRYASATWDVDSLLQKKQEILDGDLLKVNIRMK